MSPSIQEWTKYSLWKTFFKKFEGYVLLKQTISHQRLSSTNFTLSTLEQFVSNIHHFFRRTLENSMLLIKHSAKTFFKTYLKGTLDVFSIAGFNLMRRNFNIVVFHYDAPQNSSFCYCCPGFSAHLVKDCLVH